MSDLVPCCRVQGALKGLDFAICKDVVNGCEAFHKRDCLYPVNYQLFDTDDLIACQVPTYLLELRITLRCPDRYCSLNF